MAVLERILVKASKLKVLMVCNSDSVEFLKEIDKFFMQITIRDRLSLKNDKFDIIIIDFDNDYASLIDDISRIKHENNKQIVLPIISSFKERRMLTDFISLNLDFLLFKPFNIEEFQIVIGKILTRFERIQSNEDNTSLLRNRILELEKKIEYYMESSHRKELFFSSVSHDIRAPINAILGFSYLIKNNTKSPEDYQNILNIESSGKHILSLVNDILDFAKIEAGQMSIEKIKFNLQDDVIKNVSNIISVKAQEKDIELNWSISEKMPNFMIGDPLRISQILINLIDNAIKFTDKGSISIKIDFMVNTEDDNYQIIFSVKDTGIGISKDAISKLFQDFTQASVSTSREYGGTGLGLSIAKQLTRLMGGSISVNSEAGSGSEFTFDIYTEALSTKETNVNNLLEENMSMPKIISKDDLLVLSGATILVAEDNKLNQTLMNALLEGTGINVIVTNNGQELLDELTSIVDNVSLIFMDVEMPILDGYDTTVAIRKKSIDIPIVGISGNTEEKAITKAMESGMTSYLSKPIDIPSFYSTILKYIMVSYSDSDKQLVNIQELLTALKNYNYMIIAKYCNLIVADTNEINMQVLFDKINQDLYSSQVNFSEVMLKYIDFINVISQSLDKIKNNHPISKSEKKDIYNLFGFSCGDGIDHDMSKIYYFLNETTNFRDNANAYIKELNFKRVLKDVQHIEQYAKDKELRSIYIIVSNIRFKIQKTVSTLNKNIDESRIQIVSNNRPKSQDINQV